MLISKFDMWRLSDKIMHSCDITLTVTVTDGKRKVRKICEKTHLDRMLNEVGRVTWLLESAGSNGKVERQDGRYCA